MAYFRGFVVPEKSTQSIVDCRILRINLGDFWGRPFVLYSREQAAFCNSNEPKSGFACDLGDCLRLGNVPLTFSVVFMEKMARQDNLL